MPSPGDSALAVGSPGASTGRSWFRPRRRSPPPFHYTVNFISINVIGVS
jgi:hypothetical protein